MINFATVIKVTDYYDQQGEGIRLNNQTVSGVEENSSENIVIKKVLIDRGDITTSIKISDLIGGVVNLNKVNSVSVSCLAPQLYKDSYAEPIPIKIYWGTILMGSMSTFTMFDVEEGLFNDISITQPAFPVTPGFETTPGEEEIQQALIVVFIDLKETM